MIETILLSFMIALALSVDTFAACFAFGTDPMKSRRLLFYTPIVIGVFHIVFPLISFSLVGLFSSNFDAYGAIIGGVMFLILAVMAFTKKKDEKCSPLVNILSVLFLAVGVSIDSFLVGISLSFTMDFIVLPALIFGVVSCSLTYLSIHLGQALTKKISFELNAVAGIVFVILSVLTFTHVI